MSDTDETKKRAGRPAIANWRYGRKRAEIAKEAGVNPCDLANYFYGRKHKVSKKHRRKIENWLVKNGHKKKRELARCSECGRIKTKEE